MEQAVGATREQADGRVRRQAVDAAQGEAVGATRKFHHRTPRGKFSCAISSTQGLNGPQHPFPVMENENKTLILLALCLRYAYIMPALCLRFACVIAYVLPALLPALCLRFAHRLKSVACGNEHFFI